VRGKIVEINPLLQDTPEAINQDPYGKGRVEAKRERGRGDMILHASDCEACYETG
jgi:glycine cleavage system H lipoate-binding protein